MNAPPYVKTTLKRTNVLRDPWICSRMRCPRTPLPTEPPWKIMPSWSRLELARPGVKEPLRVTHNMDVTIIVSPSTVGEDADASAPATPLTAGHGMTRVPVCVVLHVTMTMATTTVDAIRTVDAITTVYTITTVDATRAADVTTEGIAGGTTPATLTPRTKVVIGPDFAHGTGTIARRHALIHVPGDFARATTLTSLTMRLTPPSSMRGTT